jgi:hypothetical protein
MQMINKHGHQISISDWGTDEWCLVYDYEGGFKYYEKTDIIFKQYTPVK